MKLIKYSLLLTILTLFSNCFAHNVLLVFPFPSKSHSILGEGFVKNLLKHGHKITYITPVLMKPQENLRQIDVSSNFKLFPDEIFDLTRLMNNQAQMSLKHVLKATIPVINGTVRHENVQKLLQDTNAKFDLVIAEWMFSEVYAGFASIFSCPLVWSSSMEPHPMVLSLIDEEPNPSYSADVLSNHIPPFSFLQRLDSLYTYLNMKYLKWLMHNVESAIYNEAFGAEAAKRGVQLQPLSETMYQAALMFGNSHVSLGEAIRLPQNYVPIAGYHLDEKVQALPQELQTIMDNATQGVIYFSLGSIIKAQSLPLELKRALLDVFGEMKETVIWKFEENLSDLPRNVHIVKWTPQQSILAHPNCILFITHGGLLSITESIHNGVPIIGVPLFGDQFNNVEIAVAKGFAKKVDLNFNTPSNIKAAIRDILESSRYKERVKELSFIYHHRPVPPGLEVAHWVDHVVKTRGAPHLRSIALDVPFYQKMFLDLAALVFVLVLTMKFLIKRLLFPKTRKVSKHKKE